MKKSDEEYRTQLSLEGRDGERRLRPHHPQMDTAWFVPHADGGKIRRLAERLAGFGYYRNGGKIHAGKNGGAGYVNAVSDDGVYYGGELAPAVVKPDPVYVQLETSRVSKEFPISHSALNHQPATSADRPFRISKRSDPTYNLLWNNCSDYTGRFLEDALGMSLTKGVTTPRKIRRAMEDSPNLVSTEKSNDGITTYQTLSIPWYDYTKAKEEHLQSGLYDYEKRVSERRGEDSARDVVRRRIENLNREQPRLQYYIDRNGNVVRQESLYVYPTASPYAEGGLLMRYGEGGQKLQAADILPEEVVTPHGNYINYPGDKTAGLVEDDGVRKWKRGAGGTIDRVLSSGNLDTLRSAVAEIKSDGLSDSLDRWDASKLGEAWRRSQPESADNPMPVDHKAYAISDVKRRLLELENSKDNPNGRYDKKTGRWMPHKSPEGGANTIAYGIKLSSGLPWAKTANAQGYLTDEQAMRALDEMAESYYDAAQKVYDGRFGDGAWDELNGKQRSILVDFQYNVAGGLRKFPSLMQATHDGDLDRMLEESRRSSNGKSLKTRNASIARDIDSLRTFYPVDVVPEEQAIQPPLLLSW